jgi:hypothetical protein
MIEVQRVMAGGKPVEKKMMVEEMPDMSRDPMHAFHLQDGRVIYSIKDLMDSLSGMPDDVFHYHVNQEKNDFANWIRDVFRMPQLAERLRPLHNKLALKQFLKTYFESQEEAEREAREEQDERLRQEKHGKEEREKPRAGPEKKQKRESEASGKAREGNLEDDWKKLLEHVRSIKPLEGAAPMNEEQASDVLKKVKEQSMRRFIREFATKEIEDSASGIKDAFNELKKRLSEMRKNEGKPYFFTGLLMKRIEPQLKMCLVTNDQKDIQKLKEMLKEIEKVIEEERVEEELDIKKEVAALVEAKASAKPAAKAETRAGANEPAKNEPAKEEKRPEEKREENREEQQAATASA